jgi:hypothetical protein
VEAIRQSFLPPPRAGEGSCDLRRCCNFQAMAPLCRGDGQPPPVYGESMTTCFSGSVDGTLVF